MAVDITEAPVEEKSIADHIRTCRLYIEEHGWAQENYRTTTGQVCMVGAIGETINPGLGGPVGQTTAQLVVGHYVRQVLDADGDDLWDAIIDWNDAPGRTESEVLDVFRKAEALARQ